MDLVELADGNRRVLLSPSLQGRVLTSTTSGELGYSFGWLNYDLIASGETLPHCNNFGGEDRFWLGPEGGQYSLFFKKGTDFSFDNWQTPSVIDSEAWALTGSSALSASFSKEVTLENYAGYGLCCRMERSVTILSEDQINNEFGADIPEGVECVAFQSSNSLTNGGDFEWNRNVGMPSIWILGQFVPSDDNMVMIPIKPSDTERINDAYFGKIPSDRLVVKNNILYFKGDGRMRGKIGTPPSMTTPICGAWDRANGTLTVVKFSFDRLKTEYVNSMWAYQEEPFKGDVINSYNDGPLDDGSIMGPFYELETSSPAANLKPGETLTHLHTTMHFKGDNELLELIAGKLFRVSE